MKFSTRTTYGLRALISLADNYKNKAISLSFISKKENISLGYLEQIFAKLKKANIVKSEKGINGGYLLSKKPNKITVFDIISSLEGGLSFFNCVNESGKIVCDKKNNCKAVNILQKIQRTVNLSLKNIKLSDLL